jgi:methylenetetrahydrofolate dehydrogenase (NADP+) / methenyltetrahydrofolate cyclohydrolase
MRSFDHRLPGTVTKGTALAMIAWLNIDPAVRGTLVQLPLLEIDPHKVIAAINPDKDADGFHPP